MSKALSKARLSWLDVSGVSALLAALGALLVIAGHLFGVPLLTTPRPGEWPAMTPNVALVVLLCAGSLWLLRRPTRRRVLIARLLAAAGMLITTLTLVEDIYGVNLRMDLVLPHMAAGAAGGSAPGRMAPSVAAALGLIGLSLLLLDTETRAGRWPAEILVAVVLLITGPRLVSYAYGVPPPAGTTRGIMAPFSAVLVVILSVGILAARSDRGFVRILDAPGVAGRAARRFLPAAILIPIVIGAVAVVSAREHLVPRRYVAPLIVSGVVVSFIVVGLATAWITRRNDAVREATMQRLQAQHAATRALIESTTVAQASPRFLAAIADGLGWDFAALWQVRREAGVLDCAHVWHRQDLDVSEFQETTLEMHLPAGVEIPGMVWLTGQPAWVPDIQRAPSLRGNAALRGGLHAAFAFPVRYDAELRGVIELYSRNVRDPDRDLVGMAPLFGGQIGEALERKRAEELLRASEDRFRAVAESAGDALLLVDTGLSASDPGKATDGAHTITYANAAAERMFGLRAAELAGMPLAQFLPDLTGVEADSRRTLERIGRRVDGSELPVELTAARWSTAEGGAMTTVIIRDITARKHGEEQLRQARDAAEASNRELEAFSYSVSHDLRTPVRSIEGFSQALLEDYGEKLGEEGRDNLTRVRAAAERMSGLIDDLLELSRTSRAALHHQRVDLSTMAREIAEELHAREPGREVVFAIDDRLTAWGDARLLRVALQNLLDNAWKFTSRLAAARIEVGIRREHDRSVYFVRDNGIGFDMALRDRLFSPFQRLHEEADFPGTGVGLALVQRVIVRHGGRIWADAAPGQGATFSFTLPDQPGGAG